MAGLRWASFVLVIWRALSVGVAAGPPPHVYLTDAAARGVVERAIVGAQSLLNRQDCRQIFVDFTDASGHPLSENLAASGRSASEYLVERLWFVDGSDESQCLHSGAIVAFTATGYKVVHVCAARFASLAQHGAMPEVIMIHELLHTLGLGENPPSSQEITRRVTARCGGR